ncbi:Beta-galactosidase [Fasciolopsis buskii]|uniref:Beta-galactosidase n=1 Tax=Fasciolopsis buskii TaxID=27845 RepID=A0A8E0VGF0_9TREM|nr:Beta-galactosidase [Fasciolopsis buski]
MLNSEFTGIVLPEFISCPAEITYYMAEVSRWMDHLLPKIGRFLYANGGPIIMVQLENEYGSYKTCDNEYLKQLYDIGRRHLGPDIILFTTDGASEGYLRCGSSDPRYLATIDFGPMPILHKLQTSRKVHPTSSVNHICSESDYLYQVSVLCRELPPFYHLVCPCLFFQVNSEFYVGWFDPWGEKHAHTDAVWSTNSLIRLMKFSARVNVNMYMFHGGTNFGYTAGTPEYVPTTTSYDYDAPVSEAGDVTQKYAILQKAIFNFRNKSTPPLPSNITRFAYGKISMSKVGHILFQKAGGIVGENPAYMESFRQYDGFGLYSVTLPPMEIGDAWINFQGIADIAYVYTTDKDNKRVKYHETIYRGSKSVKIHLDESTPNDTLLILVENRGHRNFGDGMDKNIKGLFGPVTINGQALTQWRMIGFNQLTNGSVKLNESLLDQWPVVGSIYEGTLLIDRVEDKHDTYIHLNTFKRGYLVVNDFNLGRYDTIAGPQMHLYVPEPRLKLGRNIFTVVELDGITLGTTNEDVFVTSCKDQMWSK